MTPRVGKPGRPDTPDKRDKAGKPGKPRRPRKPGTPRKGAPKAAPSRGAGARRRRGAPQRAALGPPVPSRTPGLVPAGELAGLLLHPSCQGAVAIRLLSARPFWDEEDLPFHLHGGGAVCRVVPDAGFQKESLAASQDERALIVDCPDDDGWLVPHGIVADWMARNVRHPALDDLLLSHRAYEYLTSPGDDGLPRGGFDLVQWAPGLPNLVSIAAPEFLPRDPDAPAVNRRRRSYAAALRDLLAKLADRFGAEEVEVGLRFGTDAPAPLVEMVTASGQPGSQQGSD